MGFQEPHGRENNTLAAEGGRKILAFFLVQNQDFSGKMTNFGAFWNFTDVSFGENEISTDVRFGDFFWGQKDGREEEKKTTTEA